MVIKTNRPIVLYDFKVCIAAALGFLAPLMMFGSLFKCVLFLALIIGIITFRFKDAPIKDWILPILCLSFSISTLVSIYGNYPELLKGNSVAYLEQFLTSVGVALLFFKGKQVGLYSAFKKGVIVACVLDLFWATLQLVVFYLIGLDINQLIFSDILSIRQTSSFYYNGKLCATGLAWHPICFAIVLIVSTFVFKNPFVHLLIIVLSFLAWNSTVLIGLGFCYVVRFSLYLKGLAGNRTINHSILVFGLVIAAFLLITYALQPNIFDSAVGALNRVIDRIVNESVNSSASSMSGYVHFRYYTSIPYLYSSFDPAQILFGSGLDSSGYWFTQLYGQYASLVSWVAESDYINMLLGSGVIGSVLFFSWLTRNAFRCGSVSVALLVTTFLLMGVFYNVQYLWLVFFEMVVFRSYQDGHSFFGSEND